MRDAEDHDCYYDHTMLPHEVEQEEAEFRGALAELKTEPDPPGWAATKLLTLHINLFIHELYRGKTVRMAETTAAYKLGFLFGVSLFAVYAIFISAALGYWPLAFGSLVLFLYNLVFYRKALWRKKRVKDSDIAHLDDENCEGL